MFYKSPALEAGFLFLQGLKVSVSFLAQVDFLTPMIFLITAAAELVVFVLTKTTQTPSPSQDCQPKGWPWDTRNTESSIG